MQEIEKVNRTSVSRVIPDWVRQMNDFGQSRTPFLFILDFECEHTLVVPLTEVEKYGIQFQFPGISTPQYIEYIYPPIDLTPHPVSFANYKQGFNQVMQAIQEGNTYLLNLSYSTPVSGIRDLHHAFYIANGKYKLFVPNQFVVFSPEQFVEIKNGTIRTFPMKGTIDASVENAEQVLMNDLKEQEEHATVVDLLRNDLSIVATSVTVNRYRFITKIRKEKTTLLQTSSEISGKLSEDYLDHLGDLFHALLPAGSVTGAPKKKTVELIKAIEPEDRGYYTGVCGIFDGRMVDSGVMIRMIEQRSDGFYYRSGGGITYRSEVGSEYQEMIDKIYVPI